MNGSSHWKHYANWPRSMQDWSMARVQLWQPVTACQSSYKRCKSHRQLFYPYWSSSVWCTDGTPIRTKQLSVALSSFVGWLRRWSLVVMNKTLVHWSILDWPWPVNIIYPVFIAIHHSTYDHISYSPQKTLSTAVQIVLTCVSLDAVCDALDKSLPSCCLTCTV